MTELQPLHGTEIQNYHIHFSPTPEAHSGVPRGNCNGVCVHVTHVLYASKKSIWIANS